MNRLPTLALVLCVTLLSFGGMAEEITVLDQTGVSHTISLPVRTLISVHGIGTYYVYALGGGDRLAVAYYVGLRSASAAPSTMLRWEPRLPEILSFGDPNVETLLSKDPDLILGDGLQHASFAQLMRSLGVPVVLYTAETPSSMLEAIDLTASFLGEEAQTRARAFRADHERVVSTVSTSLDAVDPEDRVRVLFVGTSPTRTISRGMYQTTLIEAAGGRSVSASTLSGGWNDVNLEQILLWDPEVVVIAPYGPVQPETILENPDWQSISAVSSGRVVRMPRLIAPIDTPVPESLLGIVWMASILYPGHVPLDLAAELISFYETYYALSLTEQEIDAFVTP